MRLTCSATLPVSRLIPANPVSQHAGLTFDTCMSIPTYVRFSRYRIEPRTQPTQTECCPIFRLVFSVLLLVSSVATSVSVSHARLASRQSHIRSYLLQTLCCPFSGFSVVCGPTSTEHPHMLNRSVFDISRSIVQPDTHKSHARSHSGEQAYHYLGARPVAQAIIPCAF
jgi:hypothetical protein